MSQYVDLPLKNRMKTFLLSENLADAHFLVGLEGTTKERIPGHAVLLATASEVFHGQLCGHFDVPETIVVDDATPETFKTVLGYIYTETVELTLDNAFPVLYLARKYLLNNLVEKVSLFIATAYTSARGQHVSKVLKHLHLLDGEHATRIWDAIDVHAGVVLASPEFLELGNAGLCDILGRDLNADEIVVYNSALAWAQAECRRKHLSFETDGREVLGNALKLIRFPLMSTEEFASGPAKSAILSDQEKLEIFEWNGLHTSQELKTFSSAPRKRLLSCNRSDGSKVINYEGSSGMGKVDQDIERSFNFSVNVPIRFHGVAFIGHKDQSNVHEVNVSLLNTTSGETLANAQAKFATNPSEDTYKVLFDRPVLIAPDARYQFIAISTGPTSLFANRGQRENDHRGGAHHMFTGTRFGAVSLAGHIPTIYYSFA